MPRRDTASDFRLGRIARSSERRRSARSPHRCGTSASKCARARRSAARRAPCAGFCRASARSWRPGDPVPPVAECTPRTTPGFGNPRSCTSQVAFAISSRNQRSSVTMSKRPRVRGPAPFQVIGEPGDRFDVEMVRRLIEGEDLDLRRADVERHTARCRRSARSTGACRSRSLTRPAHVLRSVTLC